MGSLGVRGQRLEVVVAMSVPKCDGYQMQLPVAHTRLRNDRSRECLDLVGRAFEQHGFETVVMVEVHVHRRYGDFMVRMLCIGKTQRQLPLVMVV